MHARAKLPRPHAAKKPCRRSGQCFEHCPVMGGLRELPPSYAEPLASSIGQEKRMSKNINRDTVAPKSPASLSVRAQSIRKTTGNHLQRGINQKGRKDPSQYNFAFNLPDLTGNI